MNETPSHANEFLRTLQTHAARFSLQLNKEATARLSDYYEQVNAWNTRLHLVAPCPPAEFATRHVLESLFAVSYVPESARVTDVGSGAGLPIIPCLIVRPDLRVTLIESSAKKSIFLRETLRRVAPESNAVIINKRFEAIDVPEADVITCRALDRFTEKFQELVNWSPPTATLLLFGGNSLREQIEAATLPFSIVHLPESEQRFLFIVKRTA
ncbi:MAG TPA: 16S rRNA (guanine(527)-N(7))-methyltransferase RsmG [Pyrinomonadaceae bacterium]|jgi:16S rRNA (guanine527-N7)-methyltransferase